ncbi:phosphotransferase [Tropicimonas sp.]|uniref:phosphotransferase n=1 Tax=Tropicimonas sp. TaxID=2067044 RepID=UPI003A848CFC
MNRQARRDRFVATAGWAESAATPLAPDSSNRRYERLGRSRDGSTAVLMDAPPGAGEDVRPFIRIAEHLKGLGLSAPEILAADPESGFLLLEDLGDGIFTRLIEKGTANEEELYRAAVDVLLELHRHPAPPDLAIFTADQLAGAGDLALGHYAPCGDRPVKRADFDRLRRLFRTALAGLQPAQPVMALRDFHAENLLWLPDRAGTRRVGLLDFQDAFAGHPAYDLVSLLEDARRDVPPALRDAMVAHYARRAALDPVAFEGACAVLGAQRNLRILGVFARLSKHLGKPRYAEFIPRVWGYLQRDLAHPSLAPLAAFVAEALPGPSPERLRMLHEPAPGGAPQAAMCFGAGFGTRMGALTRDRPKPLIEVAGSTLLDRTLDLVVEAQVPRRVVNTHYRAGQIANHLAARPDILLSHEVPDILETGGGLRRALPLLAGDPVFTLNTDAVWTGRNPLAELAQAWDPARMDVLVLLIHPARATGHRGAGDFSVAPDGRLARGQGSIYSGAQILRTEGLAAIPDEVFSLNLLWDRVIAAGRMFGVWHDGGWCDVGLPENIAMAEAMLAEGADG